MAMAKQMVVLCVCAVVAMSLMAPQVEACSLNDLFPCESAVTKGTFPDGACCAKVAVTDVTCFCNLVKNSQYPAGYITNAVSVPQKCGGAAYARFKGANCAGHVIG